MTDYLATLDAAPADRRWALARTWLFEEDPLAFYAQLRAERPVLELPEVTLVTRWSDVTTVLRRHDSFGVDLYKPKQGDYFMAQDDTAAHWRDKSVMKAILDREQIPKMRAWIGKETRSALKDAGGEVEAVRTLSRGIPVKLVQHWFGYRGSNPDKLIEWSYWNQQDAFWNQPFDAPFVADPDHIVAERKKSIIMMFLYLARLVLTRSIAVKLGSDAEDPVSRLLRLSFSGGIDFGVRDVIGNVGGLLIGAVETTSHTVVNALDFLMRDPQLLAAAKEAAAGQDTALFDGHVFEALRFRPAFRYFFRVCHTETPLAAGTAGARVASPGTTVLAVSHSAMFDPAGFPDPEIFDPTRDRSDAFTLGQGMHECLGRAIANAMVPEIVRQILLMNDLNAVAPPDYRGGYVPEEWHLRYRMSG